MACYTGGECGADDSGYIKEIAAVPGKRQFLWEIKCHCHAGRDMI